MTWTWISDDFTRRPNVLALSDAAFRAHIEAMVWANGQLQNGQIPRAAIRRIVSAEDITAVTTELVGAGLWEPLEDGYALDWTDQESAERVNERRALNRVRDERRRMHNKGDHSMCDPVRCWALNGSSHASPTHGLTREPRPSPSPFPSPRTGEEGGANDSAVATSLTRQDGQPAAHPWLDDGSGVSCDECGLPAQHARHQDALQVAS